ncbi:unnamed protein product [Cyclocybe aegerita]|uniref:Uncharacterized protein n=1 Tax=Cyclocybe aegerita TaxID=1973307 RepID=A0A8S0WZ35_CYCAE|nr:unnamed protein product [Cyclocybe aegerita]
MLANVDTCCVFRNTELGLIHEPLNYDTLPRSTRRTMAMQLSVQSQSGGNARPEERDVKDPYGSRQADGTKSMKLLAIRKETNTVNVIIPVGDEELGEMPRNPIQTVSKV